MLQAAEGALNCSAPPVEVAPSLRLARNQRVQAVGLDPHGGGRALTGRTAPLRPLALEIGSGERPGSVLAGQRLVLAANDHLGLAERDDGQDANALAGFIDRAATMSTSVVVFVADGPAE
jgi:hypothetical protein